MALGQDMVFEADPGTTGGTFTKYFQNGNRPFLAMDVYHTLITAGNDEDETCDSDWAYTTDGSNFTTIFNGTARDCGGATLYSAALVPTQQNTSVINVRVPAGALIRCVETAAGTTPAFRVLSTLAGKFV